jgi:hypothetical protein
MDMPVLRIQLELEFPEQRARAQAHCDRMRVAGGTCKSDKQSCEILFKHL